MSRYYRNGTGLSSRCRPNRRHAPQEDATSAIQWITPQPNPWWPMPGLEWEALPGAAYESSAPHATSARRADDEDSIQFEGAAQPVASARCSFMLHDKPRVTV